MIQFKEIKITPNKKQLVVECNITRSDYYEDMYISKILIDTLNTYSVTGPSSKVIFTKTYSETDAKQVVREVFDIDSISDNLFFIYVIAEGELAEDTPCDMKNTMALGIIFDKELIYTSSIGLIHEIEGCDMPRNFIDLMLRLSAFELALHTGEYPTAIKYWKDLLVKNKATVKSVCGCNG